MDEELRRYLNAITVLLSAIVGVLTSVLVVVGAGTTPIPVLVALPLVVTAVAATVAAQLA